MEDSGFIKRNPNLEGRAIQGKYNELRLGLVKPEILWRPSSGHFCHVIQNIRMQLKRVAGAEFGECDT